MAPGELMLFLARPQVGKTVWMLNAVRRQKKAQLPTVLFSLEMTAAAMMQRLAAITFGTTTQAIETEMANTGSSPFMERLPYEYPHLMISDNPGMSTKEMKLDMDESAEVLGPIRMVYIDYLELIKKPAMDQGSKVPAIAQDLKILSRTENCSIVCLHQVPRGERNAGDQPLSLISGRYGGEDAADYVLAAYRPALRHNISQAEYEHLLEEWFFQYLKTRSGGQIHPGGVHYRLDETTMILNGK